MAAQRLAGREFALELFRRSITSVSVYSSTRTDVSPMIYMIHCARPNTVIFGRDQPLTHVRRFLQDHEAAIEASLVYLLAVVDFTLSRSVILLVDAQLRVIMNWQLRRGAVILYPLQHIAEVMHKTAFCILRLVEPSEIVLHRDHSPLLSHVPPLTLCRHNTDIIHFSTLDA